MMAVRLAKLERITNFAKGIVAPLAEAWSASAGATVLIQSPQAEELQADELAETLDGWFWVLPVEMSGVRSGAFSLLIEQSLVVGPEAESGPTDERTAAAFARIIDEFLAAASNRLTASAGGSVALDRLGLREIPGGQATGLLSEFLGRGELVAVSFTAEIASSGAGAAPREGEVGVVFGGKLAADLAGPSRAASETINIPRRSVEPSAKAPLGMEPPAPAPAAAASPELTALLERARGLRLRLSAEVGRRTLTVRDLLGLRRGSSIDLSKSVTEPLELLIGAKRIAVGDAVVLPGGFGLRIRA
ncbi:MAG: FliM/FliN family flagellar motor switch protein [Planctomycetota bacterium]|jgi:flagellar motor switch/type III secretory pathway protein FliN